MDYESQNTFALSSQKKEDERLRDYWMDKVYLCKCINPDIPESSQRIYIQQAAEITAKEEKKAQKKASLSSKGQKGYLSSELSTATKAAK